MPRMHCCHALRAHEEMRDHPEIRRNDVDPTVSARNLIPLVREPLLEQCLLTRSELGHHKIPKREIKQLWHRRFDHGERLIWLRSVVASLSQNRPHL